ncbi:hypothetical protein [Streptomyces sp. NPDC021224]|uniref:hypothetical protein n=1 Tax=unclassified Streptomyces TaxID=2593676 RepID=UPI00378FB8C2
MMTLEERAEAVWRMLGQALDGDADGAAHSLMTIGQQSTTADMYGVCCAIAEGGAAVLRRIFPAMIWEPSEAMVTLHEMQPGALGADPMETWAARFLVAYANRDSDQTRALFDAALANGSDFYSQSVCALLGTFAGLGRARLREQGIPL